MDDLGKRIVEDKEEIDRLRRLAVEFERKARECRLTADEIERLLDLARRA